MYRQGKKLFVLFAVVALTACTGSLEGEGLFLDDSTTTDDFESQEQSLIGGTVTIDRPDIARLYFNGGSCTATLVSERALVTAKHCVNYTSCDRARCGSSYGATVQFETETGARRYFGVDRWVSFDRQGDVVPDGVYSDIRYTDTRRSDFYLNDDVALLLLEEDVPASIATPSTIAEDAATAGDPLTVWGYGCTQRGGSADGNKRYKDFAVGSQANALCPGDSGGPVTRDRQGAVTFVNSAYLQSYRGTLDIYGDVTRILPAVEATLGAWGESLGGAAAPPAGEPNEDDTSDPDASEPDASEPDTSEPDASEPDTSEPEQEAPSSSPLVFSSSQSFSIPDRSSLALTLQVAEDRTVDGVDVTMSFSHPRPIDLAFVLRSPDGSGVVLQRAGSDSSTTRSFNVSALDGQNARGEWTLEIYDIYGGAVGSVNEIEVAFQ